jgi:hypothetical protein
MKDGMLCVEHTHQLGILNKAFVGPPCDMTRPQSLNSEPFVELLGSTHPSANAYRFGYRIVGTANVISAIDVPADMVERALISRKPLSARIAPNGDIIPEISNSNPIDNTADVTSETSQIDDLIRRTLNAENLRMEEASVADLKMLLDRLERSVSLVKEAIIQLEDALKS